MAVDFRGRAVGGPTSMSNGHLLEETLLLVKLRIDDEFLQTGDLSDVLEEGYGTGSIAVNADAY
jgi:hypothetical protein